MKTLLVYFARKIRENRIGAYAAQSALFLILSMVPFLMVLIWLLGFTVVPEEMLLSGIDYIAPDMISDTVIAIVDELYHNSGGILIISVIIAIYSAAKTIQSLRDGLNIAYEVEETRNWFILRLRAMLETFILILGILALMVLLMFGRTIQGMIVQYIPWIANITNAILRFRMLILFVILIGILLLVYKAIPNRKMTFRSQLLGSVICAAAWYVLTFALSIYINYFNGFSFYGSLTALVLIMFWLYFAMFIFLVCGMFNSSMEMIFIELRLSRKYRRQQRRLKREARESIASEESAEQISEEIIASEETMEPVTEEYIAPNEPMEQESEENIASDEPIDLETWKEKTG